MQVKAIDVYGIEERIRKTDKDCWIYIKRLKEANEREKDLTKLAISKIRELSKQLKECQQLNSIPGNQD